MPLIETFNVKVCFFIYNEKGIPTNNIYLDHVIYNDKNEILEFIENLFKINAKSFSFSLSEKYNNNISICVEKGDKFVCVFQRGENGLSRSKSIIDMNEKNRNEEILNFLYETRWMN